MNNNPIFIKCLRSIMRPVIRYCLRRSLKLHDFHEVAKEIFVSLAEEQLQNENRSINISKLSLMTGVHRKDVARFSQKESFSNYQKKKTLDLPSRVIGQWQNDKRYCTKSGTPRSLRIDATCNEFAELAAFVSKELKPQSLLAELERMGVVKRTRHGAKLVQKNYIPDGNVEEGLYYLETDCDDLISAVESNLFSQKPTSYLHLKTEYTKIPESRIAEVNERLLALGSIFHQQVRNFLSTLDADFSDLENVKPQRVAVGTFGFSESFKE